MTLQMIVNLGIAMIVMAIGVILAMAWRVVVPTNLVHIVQSSKKATSYGAGSEAGNTYYKIPAAIPIFGLK